MKMSMQTEHFLHRFHTYNNQEKPLQATFMQFHPLKEMAHDLTHILTPKVSNYLFYFVVAQIQVD